jgi:hypothetical protein
VGFVVKKIRNHRVHEEDTESTKKKYWEKPLVGFVVKKIRNHRGHEEDTEGTKKKYIGNPG